MSNEKSPYLWMLVVYMCHCRNCEHTRLHCYQAKMFLRAHKNSYAHNTYSVHIQFSMVQFFLFVCFHLLWIPLRRICECEIEKTWIHCILFFILLDVCVCVYGCMDQSVNYTKDTKTERTYFQPQWDNLLHLYMCSG